MILNGLDVLNERAMSTYPVSIGTSLALESFQLGPNEPYDKDRVVPNNIDISKYDTIYINLETIYRNMLGAVASGSIDLMLDDKYFALVEEVNRIKDIINFISKGNIKIFFYTSKYEKLDKLFPYATIRKPTTEKQVIYSIDFMVIQKHFIEDHKDTLVFDSVFNPTVKDKVIIITHYPIDLLDYNSYSKFDLLESHTGILKTPDMFYTKLLNGKDLNRIRFNKLFIQIFGDKETFSPMNIKIKRLVLELSERYNWTQTTTKDRLHYCFNMIEDLEVKTLLKNLMV